MVEGMIQKIRRKERWQRKMEVLAVQRPKDELRQWNAE